MALKHFVPPIKSGYTRENALSSVDIERRNAEYRRHRAAKANEAYWDTVRESSIAAMEKEDFERKRKMVPNVIRDITNESMKIFPELIYRDYFTKLVCETLGPSADDPTFTIWEPEAVQENQNGVRYMCHAYIRDLGGLEQLKEAAIKNNSNYLARVYAVCMEAGKAIAKKKKEKLEKETTPQNVEDTKLDLSIDHEDEEMIQKSMNTLQISELSDLVRDKVLEVIKDEEVAQQKDDQFVAEMKESIKQDAEATKIPEEKVEGELPRTINNGDGPSTGASDAGTASTGGEAATDAANGGDAGGEDKTADTSKDVGKDANTDKDANKDEDKGAVSKESLQYAMEQAILNRPNLQSSLFRSLTMRCYSRAIKENIGAVVKEESTATNQDKTWATGSDHSSAGPNVYDSFMQGHNQDLYYIDFVRNSQKPAIASSTNTQVDGEDVLAEALGLYAAMECAYAIKLITPKERDLKSMISYNLAQCR